MARTISELSEKECERVIRLFWERTNKTEGDCWSWSGIIADGYGVIITGSRRNRKVFHAHRVSWEVARGQIQNGQRIGHTCDERSCVNPDHLKLKINTRGISVWQTHKIDKMPMDSRMWAYLAGLFDGEGHLGFSFSSKMSAYPTPIMSIGNTNKEVIEWVKTNFGGGVLMRPRPSRSTMWEWCLWRRDGMGEIIRGMLPYLIIKKRHAELMLRYFEVHPFGRAKNILHRENGEFLKSRPPTVEEVVLVKEVMALQSGQGGRKRRLTNWVLKYDEGCQQ